MLSRREAPNPSTEWVPAPCYYQGSVTSCHRWSEHTCAAVSSTLSPFYLASYAAATKQSQTSHPRSFISLADPLNSSSIWDSSYLRVESWYTYKCIYCYVMLINILKNVVVCCICVHLLYFFIIPWCESGDFWVIKSFINYLTVMLCNGANESYEVMRVW